MKFAKDDKNNANEIPTIQDKTIIVVEKEFSSK